MHTRRLTSFTTLLLVVLLLGLSIAGCRGEEASAETTARPLHLNLPRVHVSYDAQGEPTLLGVRLSTIERLLPLDLSMLRLPPEQIQQLMAWNLQHLEVAVAADGLFLFANNQPLPHLAWNGQSLATTGSIVDNLQLLPPTVARFVSVSRVVAIVGRGLGVGLVVRFPVSSGQEPIDFNTHPNGVAVEIPSEAAEPSLVFHMPLEFDATGQAAVDDIKVSEIEEFMGQSLGVATLDQGTMQTVEQLDLHNLLVRMETRGLVPYVDGRELPYLAWEDQHLVNLIDLVEATDLEDSLPGSAHIIELLRGAVPGVRDTDIRLSIDFPASP